MSKLIAIVGDTGVGKSHSIQFLDPKETYIISTAGKELPFKGSATMYNKENKNYREVSDAPDIQKLLNTISNDASHIKTVVIEDGNFIMGFNLVAKATELGYTKFSVMAQQMVNLIQGAKRLRDDLNIVYFSHQEEVEDSGEVTTYKMYTSGKMLSNQIKFDGLFTTVLYAVAETKGDKTDYFFVTGRYKKYPAKSPTGMFKDIKIENNLQIVVNAVNEYYK